MKLTKKQWIAATIAISVLLLLLFLFINISVFNRHIRAFDTVRTSCVSLNEGDRCNFALDGRELAGMCEKDRRDVLVCRPLS